MFSIVGVTAQTLEYPYYTGVNESSTISINAMNYDINRSVILIDNELFNMTNIGDNNFEIYISNDKEEDIKFNVFGVGQNTTTHIYENTDNDFDGSFIIDNNSIFSFWINHDFLNHTEGDAEEHIMCANLKKKTGNPIINFIVGADNGTNIEWTIDKDISITNNVFETVCSRLTQVYVNPIISPREHFGFICNNCDSNNKIELSYDDTIPFEKNGILDNYTDYNYSINSDINYALGSADIEDEYLYVLEGVLRFRIPYNVSISLYQENVSGLGTTSQYCNEFTNLFLVNEKDKDIFSSSENSAVYINKFINGIPYFGDYTESFLNTDFNTDGALFYNSAYSNCQGIVTLYDTGNYSLFLVGSKVVSSNSDLGFTNPFSGDEQFISNIVDIEFKTKENVEFAIYTSDWEISKIWVLLNVGKWLLVVVVPILLIFLIKSGVLGALLVRLVEK